VLLDPRGLADVVAGRGVSVAGAGWPPDPGPRESRGRSLPNVRAEPSRAASSTDALRLYVDALWRYLRSRTWKMQRECRHETHVEGGVGAGASSAMCVAVDRPAVRWDLDVEPQRRHHPVGRSA
jgi:hypothetical protein